MSTTDNNTYVFNLARPDGGGASGVQSIVAGTNITVDDTDPQNPIVSASGGGGGGQVDSVMQGSGIDVDATDPANPIVAVEAMLASWNGVSRATGFDTFVTTPSSANLRALLTDEVGTGAAYFVGGALGTPASATLTNATGLPVSTGISGLGSNVATFLSTPSSANLRAALTDESGSGNAYFQGGDLGTPSAGILTNATGTATGLTSGITNALKSATTTVDVSAATAPTSGQVLTATSGTAATWQTPSGGGLTLGTPQATTSGTAFDYTSLPATTKIIHVMFKEVGLSGTDDILVQIGDSGGIETSAYSGVNFRYVAAATMANLSNGFIAADVNNASDTYSGTLILTLQDSSTNTWTQTGGTSGSNVFNTSNGSKSLSATLDRVRITRSGSNTFDNGSVNILYGS